MMKNDGLRRFLCCPAVWSADVFEIVGLMLCQFHQYKSCDGSGTGLRTFARKFSNINFFLQILPLKDDELVMSEM